MESGDGLRFAAAQATAERGQDMEAIRFLIGIPMEVPVQAGSFVRHYA